MAKNFLNRLDMLRSDFEVFSFDGCYHQNLPIHFHTGFYELYFFREGDVVYTIDREQYHLSPGDLVLIPPQVMHWPIIQPGCTRYRRMFLWIDQTYLERCSTAQTDLAACFNSAQYGHVFHLPSRDMMDVIYLIDLILQLDYEHPETDFGSDTKRHALFMLLMIQINRICLNPERVKTPDEEYSQRVRSVIDYIYANLSSTDLSLQSLADTFFVSPSTLSKTFQKQMGVSLHRFIIRRRMHTAYQLLSEGGSPTRVSTQVGYSDYSAFYRAFKREFGHAPQAGKNENTLKP